MSTRNLLAAALLAVMSGAASAEGPGLGQPLSDEEIPFYARYVMPDGRGLPEGGGTAATGSAIYAEKCATCHGATGIEGPVMPPVGPNDIWAKPAGRYWPYATTLFDYIRRAMPLDAPKSLSDDEAYALAAFILAANGVIGEGDTMDAESLPKVEMPNRDNFLDVWAKQGATPW
ncbi:cytochrome c [Defluviimonas sp. WL0024]|uniref:Cytochrome c n=2 Tax=Albidovulum TaxID=205889 RepID=A0ABT3IYQ1_9RHOB|nr:MULTISPECIES: cytochrome c [Defluviimonas]MCU9848461.1 cytochrome c [Defluviimonas sp. WL0024]MCW3780554.1 cytochrome c [Defluviimonas salinarum]